MNWLKLASALTRQAQALLLLKSSLENHARDIRGNTILPRRSRERICGTLRESAELVDRAAIFCDAQHPIELEKR